ncbi:hypothetical protein CONCODRAFT_167175 [Conidiobolus coronatus NRRL 28638]|uniref:Uncharacterized protein n=1 Tax=Conidiobolus coronatus (strain ATCC 28846 / CBS 209.66 / NRRL 28638) TaxID=796925 RepID=A0A137PEJ5_CONC2|nr:hypothetical protein CONCODRAFT_167175 [Conidiobolus coronatus NRRL 28638]|eukprot:KXN73395.1 hypothetical protein CONCODRAFT_167175 [Conidiobolus coronatus NRRL 28638]
MASATVITTQISSVFKVSLRHQNHGEGSWYDEESMITPNIIPDDSMIVPQSPITAINPDSLNISNNESSLNPQSPILPDINPDSIIIINEHANSRRSSIDDDSSSDSSTSSITLARPDPGTVTDSAPAPLGNPTTQPALVPAFLDSSFFITLEEGDNQVATKLNLPSWQKLYFTFHYDKQLEYVVNLNTCVATVQFKKNLNAAKRMEIITILLMLMAIGSSFLLSYWFLPPSTSLVLEVSLVSLTFISLLLIMYRSWKYSYRCSYLAQVLMEQDTAENLGQSNPTTLTLPTYQSVYEPPPNYESNLNLSRLNRNQS